MPVSLASPEDIVNASLARIGWKRRIGSLYDGAEASKIALDVYGQTRDEVMVVNCPDFAERDAPLTLLKVAPPGGYMPPLQWSNVYPILPWIYEYDYPADCLQIRSLRPTPIFIPEFDPRVTNFKTANDNSYSPPRQVILTNLKNAIGVYTGRVTNPANWNPTFTEALIASIARRIAAGLTGLEDVKLEMADEQAENALDQMQRG